jgi:hypothetical protein
MNVYRCVRRNRSTVWAAQRQRHLHHPAEPDPPVGWVADTAELNLAAAGVETDPRGYVRVDGYLRTTAPHNLRGG